VIVTPGVALSGDVAGAGAGLITEAAEADVTSAIIWAAEHPAALVEMGERAWQFARRSLSWETTSERLAALYEEIAGSRHSREGRRA
jgi:glycosyltransferase involved in cell wall biosynthesis